MSEEIQPPPTTPAFELSTGSLPLDFANTWGDRQRSETDQLTRYADLVAFALQAGQLRDAQAAELLERARGAPAEAGAALDTARSLREAIYRLLAARGRDRTAPTADLEQVNAALGEALPRLQLAAEGDGFAWRWRDDDRPLAAPLWPLARAVADLLLSDDLNRVRECAGERCTWLFLDRSRAHSRRWCSMESCGNRAKARRHYQRRKT